jgi:hypothetical protein
MKKTEVPLSMQAQSLALVFLFFVLAEISNNLVPSRHVKKLELANSNAVGGHR